MRDFIQTNEKKLEVADAEAQLLDKEFKEFIAKRNQADEVERRERE